MEELHARDPALAARRADTGDHSADFAVSLITGNKNMLTTNPAATALADGDVPAAASGVSWAAIFAGGVTAAAMTISLLLFGAGLGLSAVSPWAGAGVSATGFTVLAAIWLIIVQWVAALFGGYMAGRLRTKWLNVHTDEVFFRDTAHGFLAWALGLLIVAGVLTSAATATVNGAGRAAAGLNAVASQNNYYVDLLFRQNINPNGASALPNDAAAAQVTGLPDGQMRAEAATILAQGAASGVSATDSAYLAQLVSGRTGLAPADAQARVRDVLNQEQAAINRAKQVTDAARKASAMAAIYTFISLLIGAFIASVAGAVGGRLRDNY
jgi:hypothetical protein